MTVSFQISDVDYDSLAELLAPMLEQQLGDSVWFSSSLTGARAAQAAKAILARLPQSRKDAILKNYINRSGGKIAELLMNAAASKGVRLTVTNVRAQED